MGKKYLDTKTYTLEASVMDVWDNLEEEEQIFEAALEEGLKLVRKKPSSQPMVGRMKGKPLMAAAKPDFLDFDKDGNTSEPMKGAIAGRKTLKANYGMSEEVEEVLDEDGGLLGYFFRKKTGLKNPLDMRQAAADKITGKIVDKVTGSDKKKKKVNKELDEGTKQVLAHGGKGQYKAVRDGGITKVMYKGKVVGTADFDRGADSFFASIKGVRGQKSFDDAQAMVNYFAKNKITEEVLDEADELDIGAGSKRNSFPPRGITPKKDRRPTVQTPPRGMLPPKDRGGRVKPSRQMLQKSSSELDIGAKKDSDPNRSDAKSQRRIPRKKMGDGGAAADDLGGPKGMKPVSATGGKELDIAPGGPDKEIKNQSREIKNPAREIKNPAKEMKRDSGGYKPITGKEKPSGGYKSITGKEKSSGGYKSIGEARQNQEFKVQSMREALEEVWGK